MVTNQAKHHILSNQRYRPILSVAEVKLGGGGGGGWVKKEKAVQYFFCLLYAKFSILFTLAISHSVMF